MCIRDRIIASWALPLALAPPMFSKDVYSYLAQGAIGNTLADPYELGPVSALGTSHALTVNVPDIWRDTPNQYGPLFLGVQKVIHSLTGDEVVAGTILVFIPVMGTFIVSDILGGRQVILVGNLIQRQFLDARDPTFGSAASLILMVMTLIVTYFYTRKFGFGEEIVVA